MFYLNIYNLMSNENSLGNVFNCHENNVKVKINLNGPKESLICLMQN